MESPLEVVMVDSPVAESDADTLENLLTTGETVFGPLTAAFERAFASARTEA